MEQLRHILRETGADVRADHPLSKHSSFRIGGSAALACFPKNKTEMLAVLQAVKRFGVCYAVIGNASNVVFDDKGFDGVVIFTGQWKELTVKENRICASAGVSLLSVSAVARDLSLTGAEFAYGIPGTLGGAVFMNAGAFGGCMADICVRSEFFDSESETVGFFEGTAQEFSNRTSIYEKQPRYTVLGAELVLIPDEKGAINARMEDFLARRKKTQPLEYPSAGSVFKRPEGHFAGKLIEDCGLKGVRVGGAEVSEKHAGFIVNRGGATSADVRELVELIRDRVLRDTGVFLECEIRFL